MNRDFELIRKILLAVEGTPPTEIIRGFDFGEKYDKHTILAHVELLIDKSMLKGEVVPKSDMGYSQFYVEGLTWDGHDFLAVAKEDTLWQKTFSIVKEKGGAMTFDVLKGLLSKLALSVAGLT